MPLRKPVLEFLSAPMAYDPTKPPRLPTELIRAILAAAYWGLSSWRAPKMDPSGKTVPQ